MSQRPTTRGIASYFHPAAATPRQPASHSNSHSHHESHHESHSQHAAPSSPSSKLTSLPPSSPSPFFSSPAQHVLTTPKPKRLEVIAASDDEGGFGDDGDDDDDDDDLEDILDLLKTSKAEDSCATPQAKRTAVRDFGLRSPEQHAAAPRHRLDLAALARDARRDEATSASSLRNQAAAAAAAAATRIPSPPRPGTDSLSGVLGADDGKHAHKVLRTVQRSDLATTQAWCCFFDRDYRAPPSSPPPRPGKASPWRLLTQGTAAERERHLAAGLPQTLVANGAVGALPDDVFQWILDEMCVSRSGLARLEYGNILAECAEHVARLITPERLQALFVRLGASEELESLGAEMTVSRPSHNPYLERDWSCVASFLSLLDMTADSLSTASAVYAIRVLLRMAFDKIVMCNIDLLPAWDAAVNRLISAVPKASWDSFCLETCTLLYSNIKEQFLRTTALLCLSPRSPASHDLRRRLAATYLFDDPAIARQHPDGVITLSRAAERLDADDFAISRTTDFTELKARFVLLDIVIDDGGAPAPSAGADAKNAFNEDVDALAKRLGEIHRLIDDSGMRLERTEAKTALKWVQKRMMLSVRTRPKPPSNPYENIPGVRGVPDASLPRQQEMMRNFFQKAPQAGST